MAKKNFGPHAKEKHLLGSIIRILRESKDISLRALAEHVGLSPSNMTYIEKGVNAPTGDVYLKIVDKLRPDGDTLAKMEGLYMKIRNLPPPDVCEILMANPDLIEKIRKYEV